MKPAVRKIIRANGGKILPFRQLPTEARVAIAYYMAVDGEAWERGPNLRGSENNPVQALQEDLGFYEETRGETPFGFVLTPTSQLQASVLTDLDIGEDWKCFEDYHAWYRTLPYGNVNYDPSFRWPVILSSAGHETLEDGWHRFHHYHSQKDKSIPCLWFP